AVLRGRYPHLQPRLRELAALRMRLARKTLAGPGPEGLAAHQQSLAEWGRQKDQLEAELARRGPGIQLERALRAGAPAGAAATRPPEGALGESTRYASVTCRAPPASGDTLARQARYAAFVLVAGEPDRVRLIDLGTAEAIERALRGFRATLTGRWDEGPGRH